jgi:hypothetical protein
MNYIPWQQNKGARVRTVVYIGAVSDHHFTGLLDIQLVTVRTAHARARARAHTHTHTHTGGHCTLAGNQT